MTDSDGHRTDVAIGPLSDVAMTPFPIIFVGPDGRIARINSAARRRFGLCVGRRCADVVNVCDGEQRQVCRYGCAWSLMEEGDGVRESRGKVAGKPARVLCSAVGEEVVVVLLPGGEVQGPGEQLTPRELEVLNLVAQGLTGKQIATRLAVSRSTVRTHVEHVREKLRCRTRAEAVARAMAMGLLEKR